MYRGKLYTLGLLGLKNTESIYAMGGLKFMNIKNKDKSIESRYLIAYLLYNEFTNNRFYLIHKLSVILGITVEDTIKNFENHQGIFKSPEEALFMDMIHAIIDRIDKIDLIIEHVENFYDKIYPEVKSNLEQAEKTFSQKKMSYLPFYNIINGTDKYFIRSVYAIFLMFLSEINIDPQLYDINYKLLNESIYHLVMNLYPEEKRNLYFNTGESIFSSRNYARYINNRKRDLLNQLQHWLPNIRITDDNFYKVLYEQTIYSMREENKDCFTPISMIVKNFLFVMNTNHIDIESLSKNIPYNMHMLNEIIEKYYSSYVTQCVIEYELKHQSRISKIYLSKDCECVPERDLSAIIWEILVYVCSCAINQYTIQYYKSFTWDKYLHQNSSLRYESIISSLQTDLDRVSLKNDSLSREINSLKMMLNVKRSKSSAVFAHEIAQLQKLVSTQQERINQLNEQLSQRDDYIKLLKQISYKEPSADIDIAYLQKYRFLFVGSIQENLPSLYQTFSNSVFMENENYNLQSIQVDGIVMFINLMSHAMYQKVLSVKSLKEVPVVYCRNRNLTNIYNQIASIVIDI